MDNAVSEREKKHRELAEKGGGRRESSLLKNAGILPHKLSEAIAVFGNGAEKTVKGGIGSGDVNNRENISITEESSRQAEPLPMRSGSEIMKNATKRPERRGKIKY